VILAEVLPCLATESVSYEIRDFHRRFIRPLGYKTRQDVVEAVLERAEVELTRIVSRRVERALGQG
jgi:hypothetical protein